ncbi:hypothetical protein B4098_1422 [Heyndrickxia coagulans]|uniref:Uncharacterized protein n=1 Tax=Heyndrickxia coagulans TaxID=1398 RepID=A0A150KJ10_HEYCO|nr:hypothetical protein B4098_1422 [Heyndrickxia coagulans]KYC73060.1 hypothetical protein B4099_1644 [Heyndrickxia coagulans]
MEKQRKLTPVYGVSFLFREAGWPFSEKISSNDYIKETPIDIG